MSKITPLRENNSSKIKIENYETQDKSRRIILNLRGTKFEVPLTSLDRWPNTRLGRLKVCLMTEKAENLKELCDDFDLLRNEFYFNKDPQVFQLVLEYYDEEKIHFDERICVNHFLKQLNYWKINEANCFDDCCQYKFVDTWESFKGNLDKQEKIIEENEFRHDFTIKCFPRKDIALLREKLWMIMEKPRSSMLAIV